MYKLCPKLCISYVISINIGVDGKLIACVLTIYSERKSELIGKSKISTCISYWLGLCFKRKRFVTMVTPLTRYIYSE